MGLLDTASDWLSSTLKSSEGKTVVIRRGGFSSGSVSAYRGSYEFVQQDEDGTAISSWHSTDFFVDAADYVIGGVTEKPQAGDEIVQVIGSDTMVYEVMSVAGQPAYRMVDPDPSDSTKQQYRIHTKRTGIE